jgi:tRNA (guanine-N7-)-methyltransferase
VQQKFLHILSQALMPDGEFLFKTDHPEYYEWVLEEMGEFNQKNPNSSFTRLSWPEESKEGWFFYPKTDFQRLWEAEGKKIWGVRFKREN